MTIPASFKNFRDMGGLKCPDGKMIRQGMLFRTPKLYASNDDEKCFIASVSPDIIIDFRCEEERSEKPDFVPDGCRYIHAPVFDGKRFKHIIVTRKASLEDIFLRGKRMTELKQHKLDSYAFMPLSSSYNVLFDAMDKGYRIAFHCTEGKDRTGIAAALIEYVFGRSEEEILSQYMLSNELRPPKDRSWLKYIGTPECLLKDIRFCESVHEELFYIAKKSVLDSYGDFDTYLKKCFSITDDRIRLWKSYYLEDSVI